MAMRLGSTPIRKVMLGSTRITKIMLGATRVYSETNLYDDFNGGDTKLSDTGRWHNEGPSIDYVASIVAGQCRLGVPDGLVGLVERISYMRFTGGVASSDDGYVECRVSTAGDSIPGFQGDLPFVTQVFGRASNSGADKGVGIHLAASQIGLVVRRSVLDEQVVKWFGAYAPNDIIRLRYTGSEFTMIRNGVPLGAWSGSSTADQQHRSLMIRVDGSKDLLGPRRFSPALDYIEMG